MSRALNVRPSDDLFQWVEEHITHHGDAVSRIVREHLEDAKAKEGKQRLLRHLGAIKGLPRDLSSRNGYSRG